MPSLPSNCYSTPYGYQFRIVVPADLRAAVGKREIKKSLGKDFREATSQARLLALQIDRQFNELRLQHAKIQEEQTGLDAFLEKPVDQRLKLVTKVTPEFIAALRSLWLAGLEADLAWRREGLEDEEYEGIQQNISDMKARIARAIARGQPEPFIPLVHQLLVGRGYELIVSPEEERQLVLDVLPALQEGYDVLEQRQAGRLVKPEISTPPLPAAWEREPREEGFTWAKLVQHWRDDRARPVKTIRDVEAYVAALRAHFPQAAPATLTRAQVTEWLRHQRESRGNSAKTLEKKGTLLGAIFSIAVKDELLSKNPFANFDYSRFAAKQGIEKTDDREPFTKNQLQRIFSVEEGIFSVTKKVGGGGYHSRVWIPIIALLTGARLDEIGSLKVADVLMAPVPHIVIRKGKTQSSVREVPLHPTLIGLGFLDYVEAIRNAGHTGLWPLLRSSAATANDSSLLGKWFNGHIHKRLKMPPTVVFHSFRHTFKDMCRDALIPSEIHDALTGHTNEPDEKNVGNTYGKGFSLETKLRQIGRIKLGFAIPKPDPYGKG